MKKICSFFVKILFYTINFTWGFLQNIIGLFMLIKYRKNKKQKFFNALVTYHTGNWGGISLGMFIFMNGNRDENWQSQTRVHEFGHCIQSLILGPFYLFAIGIPSYVWCNTKKYQNIRKNKNISYFEFYPEKWANHLGEKITRMKAPK